MGVELSAQGDESVAVTLRDVVVLLGDFPALAGLDLSVNRGEVVMLTGPNVQGRPPFFAFVLVSFRLLAVRAW